MQIKRISAPHEHCYYTDCERISQRLNCKPLYFDHGFNRLNGFQLRTNTAITLIVKGFRRD